MLDAPDGSRSRALAGGASERAGAGGARPTLDRRPSAQAALDAALRAGAPADIVARTASSASTRRAGRRTRRSRAPARSCSARIDAARQWPAAAARIPSRDGRGAGRAPSHRAAAGAPRDTVRAQSARPTSLRIRVYPGRPNTIEHVAGADAGGIGRRARDYWNARFAHDDDDAARHPARLRRVFGRGRAAWIVRVLTPDNPMPARDGVEADPAFPETETIDARAKATRAVLLPDRWCAIGYAAGGARSSGSGAIAFRTNCCSRPTGWPPTTPRRCSAAIVPGWSISMPRVAKGMALEVTPGADHRACAQPATRAPFNLATGMLERLVVVGLEWTKSAEDSAADLTELLAAHRDSTGLAFVAARHADQQHRSRAVRLQPVRRARLRRRRYRRRCGETRTRCSCSTWALRHRARRAAAPTTSTTRISPISGRRCT